MLTIRVDETEAFDENTNTFVKREGFVLELEHSLVSLSKWESSWKKPFLSTDEKTTEEVLDYIRCMSTGEDPPEEFEHFLSAAQFSEITEYINEKKTATWFREAPGEKGRPSQETFTSELIYYWMISYNIPIECQYWHLSRLLTLIKVFSKKNEKPKKMSRAEIAAQNRELNAKRKAQMNTRG